MRLIEAIKVCDAISKTAVSAGIMCDIMDNLNEFFPEYEFYVNAVGCSKINVRERREE